MSQSRIKAVDVRDAILNWLKDDDRDLAWLEKKTGIPYSSLYHCLVNKWFNITEEKMMKINDALGTKFKTDSK